MVIEDCVVWQMQNGAVFQLGWWTNSDRSNITVKREACMHSCISLTAVWV